MRTHVHILKCWPEYYCTVVSGAKPFEVRKNDRDFGVGDTLILREWCPKQAGVVESAGYSGRQTEGVVTYVLKDDSMGLRPGYVVMGIAKP
jgi:hypothetical protein